jgi:hypothetical protein
MLHNSIFEYFVDLLLLLLLLVVVFVVVVGDFVDVDDHSFGCNTDEDVKCVKCKAETIQVMQGEEHAYMHDFQTNKEGFPFSKFYYKNTCCLLLHHYFYFLPYSWLIGLILRQ